MPPGMNGSSASRSTAQTFSRAAGPGCRFALVERHGEQRDRRGLPGFPGRRAPVLVVEVEAERWIQPVAQPLESQALRRLQVQRVAIDVDPLGVAPLKSLGAVGIEHRHHMQVRGDRGAVRRAAGRGVGGCSRAVEERDRGRRLVAVHLRPQQHFQRTAAEPHVIDRSSFDRRADGLGLGSNQARSAAIAEAPRPRQHGERAAAVGAADAPRPTPGRARLAVACPGPRARPEESDRPQPRSKRDEATSGDLICDLATSRSHQGAVSGIAATNLAGVADFRLAGLSSN